MGTRNYTIDHYGRKQRGRNQIIRLTHHTEMHKKKMKTYVKTEIRAPLNLCKYKICVWESTVKTTKFSENCCMIFLKSYDTAIQY